MTGGAVHLWWCEACYTEPEQSEDSIMRKYRAAHWWREKQEREEREAERIADAEERARLRFIDAKARHAAELEDERECKHEQRVSDYRDYLRTGIVQSGMGVRVPLLMADSDKDVQWVGPATQITERAKVHTRIADEAPAPSYDYSMHRAGYRSRADGDGFDLCT
jgi:hypothetical protein